MVFKTMVRCDCKRASAPASIGNVAVGYDIFGQAFGAVRDTVTVWREKTRGVRLGNVSGICATLPNTADTNTALAAAQAVLIKANADFGLRVDIDKRVPISSGMGGSASSAVAGAMAANALLALPFAREDLLLPALEGERVSADPPPWDNVIAALFGGLVMVASLEKRLIQSVPMPKNIVTILMHPDAKIKTQHARKILATHVDLDKTIEHARRISTFTLGCVTSNYELIRTGMDDILIEPQRAVLLPELNSVKHAAQTHGALGCSFSGSGPSVFAWSEPDNADSVARAMLEAFDKASRQVVEYRVMNHVDQGARLEPLVSTVS